MIEINASTKIIPAIKPHMCPSKETLTSIGKIPQTKLPYRKVTANDKEIRFLFFLINQADENGD